ncbi:unnamed protein product [Oikopleura dioica]|uniref:G-patch domain-containing protein n=1 Tax=Oikopleura dioica TaxID=34765 RepID=E4YG14_OIKDI|nr:unnamed protein product [Oikopleura dioica]
MADLDDALVSYLSDKYNGEEKGDNEAIMNEIDDLPDSASMAGSDKSSGSSDSDSGSSSDADTVVDNRKATDEKDRLRRKKKREEKRERKRPKEEKKRKKDKKKDSKRKRREKSREPKQKKRRREHSRDRSESRSRDSRSSSRRRDDRSSSRSRRSPSTDSVRSFRSVHADFRYGDKERSRSHSRARSRSPSSRSTRSERPYRRDSDRERRRSRSRSPEKKSRRGIKEYGTAGMKTIPPPSNLYSEREHPEQRKHSDDEGDDDKYAGTGLTKEDKLKLLEIAKKNALNVHGGLNKNESIAMRAGGLTIEQLTAKASRIQSGKDDPISEDIPDDMLNHPFAVEEKEPEQLTFRPIFLKPKQTDPLALPADASMAQLTKSFPVSAGIQHREVITDYNEEDGVGEWTEGDVGNVENEEMAVDEQNGDKKLNMGDIQSAIADRVNAMRKLQENPDDNEAQKQMAAAQELLSKWKGSDMPEEDKIMPMSWAELNTGNPAWAKQEQFHVARKVTGLGRKLLEKMGWSEGMGLGKNAQGNAEPLVLDFKINREGLSAADDNKTADSFMGRKGFAGGIVKDLSGKHPVSALMEVCSKRRWGQPEFTLVTDTSAGNNRSFLYKVRVYDTEYQPATPSLNKKTGKAAAATVALQALGLVPRAAS